MIYLMNVILEEKENKLIQYFASKLGLGFAKDVRYPITEMELEFRVDLIKRVARIHKRLDQVRG